MARYIDEKDVVNLMYSLHLDKMKFNNNKNVIDFIKDIPTADIVEVVRCHNCEYHGIRDKCPLLNMSPYRDDERGYCSEGKRLE